MKLRKEWIVDGCHLRVVSLFFLTFKIEFYSQSILWASASEPAGSVPATQSQEREVGTIALWPHARACKIEFCECCV